MYTDELLRDIAATAHGRTDAELMAALFNEEAQTLPSYEPLLIRVREVLVTRYNLAWVNRALCSLNVPRRDTIIKTTGNLP